MGTGWSKHPPADEESEVVNQLLQAHEEMGRGLLFDAADELKRYLAWNTLCCPKVAILTNLEQDGNAKHMLIWYLLRSIVSSTVALTLQHRMKDGKHLLRIHGVLEWLVRDVAHVFKFLTGVSELQFMCGLSVRRLHFPRYGWQVPS